MPGSVMPNLGLTSGWVTGEDGWGDAVNSDIRRINEVTHLAVTNATTTSPPATPSDGDRYIVPAGATGLWGGQTNAIAVRQNGVWVFYTPRPGWLAIDLSASRLLRYTGSAWSSAFDILDLNVGGILSLSRETISAAGSTQAQATEVSAQIVNVATVAAGTGVRLRDQDAEIHNSDTADLKVWPPIDGRIGTKGTNEAETIYAGGFALFRRMASLTFIAR